MSKLRGNKVVGIVKEVYNKWERRAPLCPVHVQRLVTEGCRVLVQPSDRRVFTDREYEKVGAEITEDLSEASVVFGVKQVPVEDLLPDRSYVFFSHVIKAQPENMELLDALLEKNIRLFDYETITAKGSRNSPRLVAFGGFAGRAGMVSALRGLGERMLCLGYSTPFLNIGSAYMYPSLVDAKHAVRSVGDRIQKSGLPKDFSPLVFAFTGNGNVSKGAQEVFRELPHEWVSPRDLKELAQGGGRDDLVYGCVVEAEDMVTRNDDGSGKGFSRAEYYTQPGNYSPTFHDKIVPYISCLVNCTYWDHRYPRLITKDQLREQYMEQNIRKMIAVADISCDIDGSVEFLTKSTQIEQPFFLYDPQSDESRDSLEGNGVLMCGVDILPSELPNESSMHFGDAMIDFVMPLATSDGTLSFEDQENTLPKELYGACITCNGELTPSFSYIKDMRKERARNLLQERFELMEETAGNTVIRVSGHLFDSGFINHTLDIIEECGGQFYIVEMNVRPNSETDFKSSADIQISVEGGRDGLNVIMEKLFTLSSVTPKAEAIITEMPFDYCKGDFSKTLHSTSEGKAMSMKDPPSMSTLSQEMYGGSSQSRRKKALVLGSGLVAKPAIEYLSRQNDVMIVSAVEEEAKNLVKEVGRNNVDSKILDVSDQMDQVQAEIKDADVVLSLLPATMHVPIARCCIEYGKPLVTASYVSEEMKSLHEDAVQANIPILCEMGLDPGMDHMSAMKVIDEIHRDGGSVLHFSSLCGGLPAPEAANNPLRYKFSWSPKGVLSAAKNSAQYLNDGEVVQVPGDRLLLSAKPVDGFPTLSLEQLPNRDSLPYGELYGIHDEAKTVYRGTLRYAGWSNIMYEMSMAGLFDTVNVPDSINTWNDLANELSIADSVKDSDALACLKWLGIFEKNNDINCRGEIGDAFCSLLEEKLAYGSNERDMVLMKHDFTVAYGDTDELKKKTSVFIGYGDTNGDSSMAKTVGLTIGIGAQMVLEGSFQDTGVLIPTSPDIYIPCLNMLEREGIIFEEEDV